MSALFCRLKVPQNLLAEYREAEKSGSDRFKPHQVVQEPLPPQFQKMLEEHERTVVDVFTSSIIDLIHKQGLGVDNLLPLSREPIGALHPTDSKKSFFDSLMDLVLSEDISLKSKIRYVARSAFAALSGHGDYFESTRELCDTVRDGVFLPSDAMPSLQIRNLDGSAAALNAYILDMWNWKSGPNAKGLLEKHNYLREADAFKYLKDFMLILQAVASSLHVLSKELERSADRECSLNPGAAMLAVERRLEEMKRCRKAFEKLTEEFEENLAILFEYSVKRRYLIFVNVPGIHYKALNTTDKFRKPLESKSLQEHSRCFRRRARTALVAQ
jgi:hypothetical protein